MGGQGKAGHGVIKIRQRHIRGVEVAALMIGVARRTLHHVGHVDAAVQACPRRSFGKHIGMAVLTTGGLYTTKRRVALSAVVLKLGVRGKTAQGHA